MGQAINTLVNGSSGTCTDAADWLRKLGEATHASEAAMGGARGLASSGWHGPAHDAFDEAAADADSKAVRVLADQAARYERGFREFAAALTAVNRSMDDATRKARDGGLQVDGPLIVAPAPPTAPGPGTLPGADPKQNLQRLAHMPVLDAGYNSMVADYNAKIAVFNECKAIVEGARRKEGEAHMVLREALDAGPKQPGQADPVATAITAVATARTYVGTMRNETIDDELRANRLEAQSKFLRDFAHGVDDANPAQRRILDMAADKADDAGKTRAKVDEFKTWTAAVPKDVRAAAVAHPFQGATENIAEHSKSGQMPKSVAGALRAGSWAGMLLSGGLETRGAMRGEQSWEHAAVNFGTVQTTGWLGAVGLGAAAGEAIGGPYAAAGGAIVGGVAVPIFGRDVVTGVYNRLGRH